MNSGDFVLRLQRQAHRQLAALTMQPERGPSAVAVDGRAVELFDVSESRGEVRKKFGRFRWWQRLAHLRGEQLLHGGVIACVEQINNLVSDDGVAIGFLGGNGLRDRLRGLLFGLPVLIVHSEAEHQKEPNPNNSGYAENGDLP